MPQSFEKLLGFPFEHCSGVSECGKHLIAVFLSWISCSSVQHGLLRVSFCKKVANLAVWLLIVKFMKSNEFLSLSFCYTFSLSPWVFPRRTKSHRQAFSSLTDGKFYVSVSAMQKLSFRKKWFSPLILMKTESVTRVFLTWWQKIDKSPNPQAKANFPKELLKVLKFRFFPVFVSEICFTNLLWVKFFEEFYEESWDFWLKENSWRRKNFKMEKVKRFLKVIPPTDDGNNRPRQQVYSQVHPQVGRRRRKSRAKRDGWVLLHLRLEDFFLKPITSSRRHSRSDGRLTGPGSIVSVNPSIEMPMIPIGQPETLRQKAFAKLRLFNLSLNWDLHLNQCKYVLGMIRFWRVALKRIFLPLFLP